MGQGGDDEYLTRISIRISTLQPLWYIWGGGHTPWTTSTTAIGADLEEVGTSSITPPLRTMRLKKTSENTFGSSCHSSNAGFSSNVRIKVGMKSPDPGIGRDILECIEVASQRDMGSIIVKINVDMRQWSCTQFIRGVIPLTHSQQGEQALMHPFRHRLSDSYKATLSYSYPTSLILNLLIVVVSLCSRVISLLSVGLPVSFFAYYLCMWLTLKLLEPLPCQFCAPSKRWLSLRVLCSVLGC